MARAICKIRVEQLHLYEVGIRLKQTLLLIGRNSSPHERGVAGVRQALTLLRVAFTRLLAHETLTDWRDKAKDILDGADRDWEGFSQAEEDFDRPLSVVRGRIDELETIAAFCADALAPASPKATAWLNLGREIITDWRKRDGDRTRLVGLLASVGVQEDQLLPSTADIEDLHLHEEFEEWRAAEAGLRALRQQTSPSPASKASRPEETPWFHSGAETQPADYPHGPLEGTQKDLAQAMHPESKRDRRYLKGEAEKGTVWVQKRTGQHFLVYFKESGRYEKARLNLAAATKQRQNDAKKSRR
jgi:hypothetical protein